MTPGGVAARVTFGAWTGFFDRHYVRHGRLWPTLLAPVFPHLRAGRTIGVVRPRLEEIRRLRNRVFHHEPVWDWPDLPAQHARIAECVGWICPETQRVVRAVDRFAAVHAAGAAPCEAVIDGVLGAGGR